MHVAACFRLVSPLDFQEEQQDAKRVPDGHGRSFESWPLQKASKLLKSTNKYGKLGNNIQKCSKYA